MATPVKKRKLTPSFPGSVKPVHVGVYLRQGSWPSAGSYSHWDGHKWSTSQATPLAAHQTRRYHSSLRTADFSWRGLAEKP